MILLQRPRGVRVFLEEVTLYRALAVETHSLIVANRARGKLWFWFKMHILLEPEQEFFARARSVSSDTASSLFQDQHLRS